MLHQHRRIILLVSAAMLALRIAWVLRFPEIDSDAYGHYFIAIAARRDPTNLAVHWVWLPLFHFLVGGLTVIGVTFRGVRLLNALIATIEPFLIYETFAKVDEEDRHAALTSALVFAIAPLTIGLGQSAQPETLFSVLIVASIFEASRERWTRAGVWLAISSLVRYEAWGAALALCIWWLIARARRKPGPAFSWVAIPAGVIASYVLFRYWTDGKLLLFFRGTHDITKVQVARSAWTFREIISFPIVVPFFVFGPVIALVPFGVRRALPRPEHWVVPLGFASFLLLSYYGGASHAGERYLMSLVPFMSAAIGFALVHFGRKLGRERAIVISGLVLVALMTGWQLRRGAKMANDWEIDLRAKEAEHDRLAR